MDEGRKDNNELITAKESGPDNLAVKIFTEAVDSLFKLKLTDPRSEGFRDLDLPALAAVVIGIKPARVSQSPVSQWFIESLKEIDPSFASDFDVINIPVLPEKREHPPEDWFVNKHQALKTINNNSDFFDLQTPLKNYQEARQIIISSLSNSDKRATTEGLLFGYPRDDSEAFQRGFPTISDHLSKIRRQLWRHDHEVDHLKEIKLGRRTGKFIAKYVGYPGESRTQRLLSRIGLSLLSRHTPINDEEYNGYLNRFRWIDKYGSTTWIGSKKNSAQAKATIERINRGFEETGMGKALVARGWTKIQTHLR